MNDRKLTERARARSAIHSVDYEHLLELVCINGDGYYASAQYLNLSRVEWNDDKRRDAYVNHLPY